MRGNQVSRQWKILKVLESHKRGLSAAQISARLGVPVRTVYRDLESIHDAGFPIYNDREDKNSYWKFVEGFKSDLPLPLTATELMSLHMSRDILRVFEGTIFQESIESLFDKVQASLPAETIRYLETIAKKFRVGLAPAKDYRSFRHQIAALSDATAQKKRVEIRYKALSTGEESKRTVDPYQMWAMNGTFYLIGYCHLRGTVRTFAMDRIKDFTVLGESFDMPEDFSLEDYLQTAFRVMTGKPEVVKVWFRASAAQVVKERIWHPTQELREQEDGSVVVTLEVPINYEVIAWILGFGSAAKVIGPEALQRHVIRELETSLVGYEGKSLWGPEPLEAKEVIMAEESRAIMS
jgi:predicted DNA-binding transcriptional regulator YafY